MEMYIIQCFVRIRQRGGTLSELYYLKTIGGLWRATRIKRGTYAALSTIVAGSFTGIFDTSLFLLILLCYVVYAIGGLVNALKDNDFPAVSKREYMLGIFALILFSVACSLFNVVLSFFVIAGLLLGYLYSHFSRYLLYGDIVIGGLYHIVLPMVTVFSLHDLSFRSYGSLVFTLLVIFTFLLSVKNMNGYEDDKKRGYVTFMTLFPATKGTWFTFFSSFLAAVLIFLVPLHVPMTFVSIMLLMLCVPVFYFLFRSVIRVQAGPAIVFSRTTYFLLLLSLVLAFEPGLWSIGLFLLFSSEFLVDFFKLTMHKMIRL